MTLNINLPTQKEAVHSRQPLFFRLGANHRSSDYNPEGAEDFLDWPSVVDKVYNTGLCPTIAAL